MNKEAFLRVGSGYKNPRNLTSGIVKTFVTGENISELAYELEFYAYRIMNRDDLAPHEQNVLLEEWNFNVPYSTHAVTLNAEFLLDYTNQRIIESPYEIDGIVIYYDEVVPYPKSGNPKHIIAFKIPTETITTTVTNVIWEASRHGKLKPRVHYEPIELSGATLSYASGYNARYIVDNNIGPGALIEVTRSGGVIPKIIGIVRPAPEGPSYPELSIDDYQWDENGVEFVLKNNNIDVEVNRIHYFIKTLGIKNMGEQRVRAIYDSGIHSIDELINSKIDDFLAVEHFGDQLAEMLYRNLHQSLQNVPLATLMDATGFFPNIGKSRLEIILETYPDILEWAYSDKKLIVNLIQQIKGFNKLATVIAENLSLFYDWLDKHSEIVVEMPVVSEQEANLVQDLAGQIFVFSGFRDADMERDIKKRGGKIATAISKKTSMLIMKNTADVKGKAQKALEYNIPLIESEDFIKKYLQ